MSSNNVNNFTNINRPDYGGGGPWGGRYGGYGGYRPSPYGAYHAGWVNGFWNGNYARGGGGGWNNWGLNALGLGMGIGVASWGLGSLWNSWGYSSFVNPYYAPAAVVQQPTTVVVQQPVVYDYSRPLDVTSPPPAQSVIDQAVASLDSARASFQAGDYVQALKLADQAIQQTPNDPTLHEFRSMCLFALGRYDDASVPMYSVLSTGPGWDWTTMAGLYPNIEIYTQQLRSLEAYCNANPQAASARFLLAAHYMTQGFNDAAAAILKQVVALQPRDNLSAQLLTALTASPPADQTQASSTPEQPPAAATAVAAQPGTEPVPNQAAGAGATDAAGPSLPTGPVPAQLAGTWSASPAKDVTISLAMDPEEGFTWKVTERGQSRQFQGAATFDNDVLALSPPDQPPMVGTVAWKDDAHFQFKAIGAPPNDPGLTFSK
jgi:tetratricopeptide (TPR) repeat protein